MSAASAFATLAGTLVAAVIDARTGYIPNGLTLATAVAALVLAAPSGIGHAVLGACVVGGVLLGLHLFTRGRGLGFGDVKLGAAIGAGLGPWCGIAALGAAFVAGGAYAAVLLARGRAGRRDTIAFAPFLAAGTLLAVSCVVRGTPLAGWLAAEAFP
ncbi:MAG TPA: A24 family peptidase [Candidatus Elarobacter sp.]|jgi:prepilin signal peptidase PulO-like enzyme (type II secretory pathway)|nr:A24 family peptidase [Candidatus Elarobacter sp.]